jgi:WD40 repeat protein
MQRLAVLPGLLLVLAAGTACQTSTQAGVVLVGPAIAPQMATATLPPAAPTLTPASRPVDMQIAGRLPISAANAAQLAPLAVLETGIGPLLKLAFAGERPVLAVSDRAGGAQFWDLDTLTTVAVPAAQPESGEQAALMSRPARLEPGDLVFTEDDSRLMAVDRRSLRVWDLAQRRLVVERLLPDNNSFDASGLVALSPDGLTIARVGFAAGFNNYRGGLVRLHSLENIEQMIDLAGHNGWVEAVAFDATGQFLATGGSDHHLLLWALDDLAEPVRDLDLVTRTASALVFSADGRQIAAADRSNTTVRVWDTYSGDLLFSVEADNPTLAIAFSPDGALLAAAESSGSIGVWDAATGQRLAVLTEGAGAGDTDTLPARDIAFSPDGALLAAYDSADRVILWGIVP